jgi:20S proteasome subunit beta 1
MMDDYGLKPGEVSTGTTIMAISCGAAGVVLGADGRVSTGSYVANRVSDKIVQVAPHIFVCRSGSAADTQALTDYLRYYLSSLALENNGLIRVRTAAHLMARLIYNNKDQLSAGVIVAGWDPVEGGTVYNVPAGGSCLQEPFCLGGSGSGYIYGLVDAVIRNPSPVATTFSLDQARVVIKQAISHAMARDGSSGGIIRTVVIPAGGTGAVATFDRDYTPGNDLPLDAGANLAPFF